MRTLTTTTAVLGTLLVIASAETASTPPTQEPSAPSDVEVVRADHATEAVTPEALTAVVQRYCQVCHNEAMQTGSLSLEGFDVAQATQRAETAERMIRKLRAGMMPPPGQLRPGGDTMLALVETLEDVIDKAAARNPNPGARPFQRLNRAEYEAAVKDVLGLDIDAGAWLPLDTKSNNFDNIADAQTLSPTLLNAYLGAAAEISRLAVGNPDATESEATFNIPRIASQMDRVEGAPYGSRGGVSVMHNFPADGEYSFRVSFYHETTGGFVGGQARGERVEISVDGDPVVTLDVDRFMSYSDPNQATLYTDPVQIRAGPHRVSAVFIPPQFQDVAMDLISPLGWSIASTAINDTPGFQLLPHMRDFVIAGPTRVTGVSETPIRKKIFSCRPTAPIEERACAQEIITKLGSTAYRRPLTEQDVTDLMGFYEQSASTDGFELGIRNAIEAMLSSPDFVFRLERVPAGVGANESVEIADADLASRLSFFLWGTPPDAELTELARQGRLSDERVLEQQARRMLADPRSEALATRFAAQWLRLPDLVKVFPDIRQFTHFDEQLRSSMQRETELFFYSLVKEDKSLLDFYTADYTYVDERLAAHYGIPGVAGSQFRRVQYPDETRRGILGHGSVLVLTSHAIRSSPVLRGKWVMEVLLGTPPPPPPPGVPDLEATAGAKDGRLLTTRERMEIHRANMVCNACHQFMDPIGLSLDNFDVTGKWRIKENGMPLDTQGKLYDGTPVSSPKDLLGALMQRPIPLVRTFTENLMAYGLGRRVEYFDKPTLRAIVRDAEKDGYRMSSFVLGVVKSDAFRMQKAVVAEDTSANR